LKRTWVSKEVSDLEIRNKRLSDEEFFKEREEVLAYWPTGKDVDLDEAVEYHRNMPPERVYANRLEEAKRAGAPLNYTYNGTPILEWQIELIKELRKEGAGLLTTHVDSFTRQLYYERAAEAVEESRKAGKALLNGFPIPIHGVAASRKLIESVDTAIMISGNSVDWRFTQEVGLAGGHTASSTDPFFCYFCYNRDTPLETTLHNWQYISRLRGYYEERGCPIVSKPEGTECALCPPSIEDALRIIAYILAAEQGCKHFLTGQVAGLNLAQDIAESITLPRLAREYLDRFGYKDTVIYGGVQSWNGRYPYNRYEAIPVIFSGPIVAVLARLQASCCFTIDEAHEIPTRDAHIATLRTANMLVNLYKDQQLDVENMEAVKTEARMNELETRAVLDKVLEMGDGDVAIGVLRAVEAGVVDTPFSTSRYVARKVLGVRDAQGAPRFLDFGNLPFNEEIKEFHREKLAERARKQGSEISYDTLVSDLLSVSEGFLVR
jgi:methylaspartate mutase epsilon subunit